MEIPLRPFLVLCTFSLCLFLNVGFVWSLCLEDQRSSLLKLKQTLIFDPALSSKLVSWNSSIHCCSWPGVTCSGSGHVIGLDLSEESISGGIDNSSSLFNLHHLQSLSLAWNSFNGTRIPSGLGKLVDLRHLNLSNSEFAGQIPAEISDLTRLVSLDFSIWSLYVLKLENPNLSMLVRNLTRLTELHLQGVDLSAEGHNWGRALSSLPRLRVLNLADFFLSGPIDSSLAKLRYLSVIRLGGNNISSSVPEFLSNFWNLTLLDIARCDLRGNFPKKVLQLPNLQGLNISDNPLLQGSLPEFFENGSLQTLMLSATNFSGIIPDSIGNLKGLSIMDLSFCNFKGSIPNSIGSLTNLISFIHWENLSYLVNLELGNNSLEGTIPSPLFSLPSLQIIYLANNQFSGQIGDFPVVSSSQLVELDLSSNRLEGPIPSSFFELQSLQLLILSCNNFSGTLELSIIQKLGNCGLQILNLNENSLEGKLPESLANCKMLEVLDIGNNGINDSFPCWLSTISTLQILVLRSNKFYGSIECPMSNETLPLLHIVDLASNKFGGKLPKKFFETWTGMLVSKDGTQAIFNYHYFDLIVGQLYYQDVVKVTNIGLEIELVKAIFISIDFSCNKFEGKIPEVIGEFKALIALNLSHNSLTGPIPSSLGNLHNLESLDLSSNNLTGNIPQQLGGLNFLAVLNLSHNQLEGRIPKGNQLQTFSEDSFKDNKGLCGAPLMACRDKVQPLPQDKNSNDGTKIDRNLIGVEGGFVFGLAIVILPLMFC
ncbi:hypothetical protein SLEP1_g17998 [Rubroshorea leprosula]|uniref:Leucine-rich repeat-containing N-terminal plant-type domain-containing protein n=1 Tax=Rubroshorea leprosula TaxID=152421 RepID=A0AAV5IW21_9ROSI|nr:hypothetical protein SLEP1_g17998 [Rubroshorea leprosula]